MKTAIFALMLFNIASHAVAATYHVRSDGGTAAQCTGKADAAYPGTGLGKSCAWSSPMIALPPAGSAPLLVGGDVLKIHYGEYMMGYQAPGTSCSSSFPWDCYMQPVPSGAPGKLTRIVGLPNSEGKFPQLWGTERTKIVLNLIGTSYAEVSGLELTDHSSCVYAHPDTTSMRCKRSAYPYGTYADNGIWASDGHDIRLSNLNVHGFAHVGIIAGRIANWTVDNVRIAANGWAGWNGDMAIDGTGLGSSNSGTLAFDALVVEWNGCGETYPELQPIGCFGQEAGGYGDGMGTGSTGGVWTITNSDFKYNVSDGLDLLYHDQGGAIVLDRVLARGNGGNQVKLAGTSTLTNSVIHGSCGFFTGKSFTYNVDQCRALGDALVFSTVVSTDTATAYNNTIGCEGNVAIDALGAVGSTIKLRNNIMVGWTSVRNPVENCADTYIENVSVDRAYELKQNLKAAACTTPNTICADAGLVAFTPATLNPRLRLSPASPALNSGLVSGAPAFDYYGNSRGSQIDRGAVDMTP